MNVLKQITNVHLDVKIQLDPSAAHVQKVMS